MGQTTAVIPLVRRVSLSGGKEENVPLSINKITLQLVTGEVVALYIDSSLTCGEFKELLYQGISRSLEPEEMVLRVGRRSIPNVETLGDVLLVNDLVVQ
jgi:hypothetical protein